MGTLKEISSFAHHYPIVVLVLGLAGVMGITESIQYLTENKDPEVQHRNVIGGSIEDTFVEINGTKYYSKVDGLPVDKYSNTINPTVSR